MSGQECYDAGRRAMWKKRKPKHKRIRFYAGKFYRGDDIYFKVLSVKPQHPHDPLGSWWVRLLQHPTELMELDHMRTKEIRHGELNRMFEKLEEVPALLGKLRVVD